MDDRAGQGTGDAVHLLDLRDHHAAEVVHGVGLGPHDHVIRSCHVLGLDDSRDLADRLGDGRRLADLRLDQDVRLYHGTSRAATRIMWGKGTPRYRVAARRGETCGGQALRAGVRARQRLTVTSTVSRTLMTRDRARPGTEGEQGQ